MYKNSYIKSVLLMKNTLKILVFLCFLIILAFCSMLLFPSGNKLTAQEVKQRISNRKLADFVRTNLQTNKYNKILYSNYIYSSESEIKSLSSDFIMFTNVTINVNIFGTNNNILAHEITELWRDNSIAVFFSEIGVIRIPQYVFNDLINLDTNHNVSLKYIKHSNIWKTERDKNFD